MVTVEDLILEEEPTEEEAPPWWIQHQQQLGWWALALGALGLFFITRSAGGLPLLVYLGAMVTVLSVLSWGVLIALWGRLLRIGLTAVGVAILLSLPMLAVVPIQLSAYGDGPGHYAEFRSLLVDQGFEVQSSLISPLLIPDEEIAPIVVVMGVERPYQKWERRGLVEFVEKGGVLILADDFGHGNSIARDLSEAADDEVSVQFFSAPLYPGLRSRFLFSDPALHNSSALVPVIANLNGEQFLLISNIPTGLRVAGPIIYLANSTNDSVIDQNDSGTIDLFDKTGPIEMIVEIKLGEGRVVFCSDPSMFIDQMIGLEQNAEFTMALFHELGAAERTIIFEESRHLLTSEKSTFDWLNRPLGGLAATGLGIIGIVITLTRSSLFAPAVVGICLIAATWLLANAPAKGDMTHKQNLHKRQGGLFQMSPRLIRRRVKRLVLEAMETDLGIDREFRSKNPDNVVRRKIGNQVLARIYFDHHEAMSEQDCIEALNWLQNFRDQQRKDEEDDFGVDAKIIEPPG